MGSLVPALMLGVVCPLFQAIRGPSADVSLPGAGGPLRAGHDAGCCV